MQDRHGYVLVGTFGEDRLSDNAIRLIPFLPVSFICMEIIRVEISEGWIGK